MQGYRPRSRWLGREPASIVSVDVQRQADRLLTLLVTLIEAQAPHERGCARRREGEFREYRIVGH